MGVIYLEGPLMAASVTLSQPRSLCALALDFSTVRQALSRRTPWSAHPVVAEFVKIDEDKMFLMISMFPTSVIYTGLPAYSDTPVTVTVLGYKRDLLITSENHRIE